MKSKLYLLIVLLFSLLCSCIKNEFNVEMSLSDGGSASFDFIYFSHSKKSVFLSNIPMALNEGIGTVRCVTAKPTLVWILSSSGEIISSFYAERGDKITITGSVNSPEEWKIGGNKINEQWSEWRTKNAVVLRSRTGSSINKAVAEYVKENPKGVLSALLMLTTYDRSINEDEYVKLWNSIDEDARKSDIVAAVGRSDQLSTDNAEGNATIKELSLYTSDDTIVKVRPSDYHGIILYFWRSDETVRHKDIDTLKSICASYKHNDDYRIIDISFNRDTISWKPFVRRDSVKSECWIKAWAPGGQMHSSISELRVKNSPYFIVLDSKGKQKYRGDEASEVSKVFRGMVKRSEPKVNNPN